MTVSFFLKEREKTFSFIYDEMQYDYDVYISISVRVSNTTYFLLVMGYWN